MVANVSVDENAEMCEMVQGTDGVDNFLLMVMSSSIRSYILFELQNLKQKPHLQTIPPKVCDGMLVREIMMSVSIIRVVNTEREMCQCRRELWREELIENNQAIVEQNRELEPGWRVLAECFCSKASIFKRASVEHDVLNGTAQRKNVEERYVANEPIELLPRTGARLGYPFLCPLVGGADDFVSMSRDRQIHETHRKHLVQRREHVLEMLQQWTIGEVVDVERPKSRKLYSVVK